MLEKFLKHGQSAREAAAAKKRANEEMDKKRREKAERERRQEQEEQARQKSGVQIREVTDEEAARIQQEINDKVNDGGALSAPT